MSRSSGLFIHKQTNVLTTALGSDCGNKLLIKECVQFPSLLSSPLLSSVCLCLCISLSLPYLLLSTFHHWMSQPFPGRGSFSMDFSASRIGNVRNKSLFFIIYPVSGILIEQHERDQNMSDMSSFGFVSHTISLQLFNFTILSVQEKPACKQMCVNIFYFKAQNNKNIFMKQAMGYSLPFPTLKGEQHCIKKQTNQYASLAEGKFGSLAENKTTLVL